MISEMGISGYLLTTKTQRIRTQHFFPLNKVWGSPNKGGGVSWPPRSKILHVGDSYVRRHRGEPLHANLRRSLVQLLLKHVCKSYGKNMYAHVPGSVL